MKNTEKQLYYIPFNDFNNAWYKEYQGKIVDRIIPYCYLVPLIESNKNLYLSNKKKEIKTDCKINKADMIVKLQLMNKKPYPTCDKWSKAHNNSPVYCYMHESVWFNEYPNFLEFKVYGTFYPNDPNWGMWAKRKDLKLVEFILPQGTIDTIQEYLNSETL